MQLTSPVEIKRLCWQQLCFSGCLVPWSFQWLL